MPYVELDAEFENENVDFEKLIDYFDTLLETNFSHDTKKLMISWLYKKYQGSFGNPYSKFYFARKLFLIFATRKFQKNDKELPEKEDFNYVKENPEKKRIEAELNALGDDPQFQI